MLSIIKRRNNCLKDNIAATDIDMNEVKKYAEYNENVKTLKLEKLYKKTNYLLEQHFLMI